jgi:ribonuclease HI
MAKKNYYVVWRGWETGIFDNWQDCYKAIKRFSQEQYKGFTTKEEAIKAFEMGYDDYQRSLFD